MEIILLGKLEELVFIFVLIEFCDILFFLKYYRYINVMIVKEIWWNVFYEQMFGNVFLFLLCKKYYVFFVYILLDIKWVNDIVKCLENFVNSIVCCFFV